MNNADFYMALLTEYLKFVIPAIVVIRVTQILFGKEDDEK